MAVNTKEVAISTVIAEMDKLYHAGVGLMMISLPGIGKTEMITQECKKILTRDLGSKEAADEAFFIVDMSGIPSESLAVPYINPAANKVQYAIEASKLEADRSRMLVEYLKMVADPNTDESVREMAKTEVEIIKAQLAEARQVAAQAKIDAANGDDRYLFRDVIAEIRNAQQWMAANPGKKCIVFIDEITSANQDDQRTLMNFIQSGISPDGTRMDLNNIWFVLAGNPSAEMPGYEDYDGATNPIEEAVITRVATFFVKADVESLLEWGKQTGVDGNSNIHPYLTSALEKDKSMYMKRPETEIRLMNSRTVFKLSQYFRAAEAMGQNWNFATIDALVGNEVGAVLRRIIEQLDRLMSIEELFGSAKTAKISDEAMSKFKALQEFEKFYIFSAALDESSTLTINDNNVKKIVQLMSDGGIPTESMTTLAKRIIDAPAKTKLAKLKQSKYLLDKKTSVIAMVDNMRKFASGGAFTATSK